MAKSNGLAVKTPNENRLGVTHRHAKRTGILKAYRLTPEIADFVKSQSQRLGVTQRKFVEGCIKVAGKRVRFTLTCQASPRP